MLQVAKIFLFTVILVIVSGASAQTPEGENVPAFLQEEIRGSAYSTPPRSLNSGYHPNTYQQPQDHNNGYAPIEYRGSSYQHPAIQQPMAQQPYTQQDPYAAQQNSEPAFLQQELQQQYQQQGYQPPVQVYQPAPGDTPAFVTGDTIDAQTPAEDEGNTVVKTNNNQDVLQINFSEEQYNQKEVEKITDESAIKYNTVVKAPEPKKDEELKEGDVFTGDPKQSRDGMTAVTADGSATDTAAEGVVKEEAKQAPEPERSADNLIRISYPKNDVDLTEKDRNLIKTAIKDLKWKEDQKIIVKSFASNNISGDDSRKTGLQRVMSVREYLIEQGVDFNRVTVKVFGAQENKADLDYIDIDKI